MARPLKWLDDRFWGTVPRARVKWLGYDSGRLPTEPGCNIAGCSCHSGGEITSKIGFYAPLKENANRFERAKAGSARAGSGRASTRKGRES